MSLPLLVQCTLYPSPPFTHLLPAHNSPLERQLHQPLLFQSQHLRSMYEMQTCIQILDPICMLLITVNRYSTENIITMQTSYPLQMHTLRYLREASICSSRLPVLMPLFGCNIHPQLTREKSYFKSTSNSTTVPLRSSWPTTSRGLALDEKACSCKLVGFLYASGVNWTVQQNSLFTAKQRSLARLGCRPFYMYQQ